MRRRLIAALAGVAIATLALYAGPRTLLITDMVRERESLGLERTADLLVDAIDTRVTAGMQVDDAVAEILRQGRDDIGLVVRLADGTSATAGELATGERTERRLADGGRVTVWLDDDAVDGRVARALVPVALFAILSVAFAVVVAIVLARRLSRPFTRLADHADRLGLGVGDDAPRSGVPEADLLADALDRSQRRIAGLLQREREFSSNASHQLRTPLAALRLRIEDLALWPETSDDARAELQAALTEVDRLSDTVTDLLELARAGGIGGWRELDVHDAVAEAVERWQGRFDEEDRHLSIAPSTDDALVATSARAVDHVLDVLFENALRHGAGVVELTVEGFDTHVALCIADEGAFDHHVVETAFTRQARSRTSTGSGIGLDLARTIAESAGARLDLISQDPTVFELRLPRHAAVPVRR